MKFKYNIKDNYYKMYGEANYLVSNKKAYLSGKKKIIRNYFTGLIIRPIITLFLMFISILLNKLIFTIALFFVLILYLFLLIISLNSYEMYKKQNHVGEITINKTGIRDDSDIKTVFPWDKVLFVGMTENMLAVVLDSPFVLILEPNEKIVEEILKYKDVKVIK